MENKKTRGELNRGKRYTVRLKNGRYPKAENTFAHTGDVNFALLFDNEEKAQRLAKLCKAAPIRITSDQNDKGYYPKWVEFEFLELQDVGEVDPSEFKTPKKKREGSYWPDRKKKSDVERVTINGKTYPVIK